MLIITEYLYETSRKGLFKEYEGVRRILQRDVQQAKIKVTGENYLKEIGGGSNEDMAEYWQSLLEIRSI